jgi:hypothetical protein
MINILDSVYRCCDTKDFPFVHLEVEEDRILSVATNNHVLGVFECPLPEQFNDETDTEPVVILNGLNLHTSGMKELISAMRKAGKSINRMAIKVSEEQLVCQSWDGRVLGSVKILHDANFPLWRKYIPTLDGVTFKPDYYVAFIARYFSLFADCCAAIQADKARFKPNPDCFGPAVFSAETLDRAKLTFVLMPCG